MDCLNGWYEYRQYITMMQVEMGQWHRLEALAPGTVILEFKNGAYEAAGAGDVLEMR